MGNSGLESTTLGRAGPRVSKIGLGAWQFGTAGWGFGREYGRKEAIDVINAALDMGINLIDTAEAYGHGLSEEIVGEAVRERRDEAIIATKIYPLHLRYGGILKAADRSLRRLRVDAIDLYQVHWPNPLVPISRYMKAFQRLIKDGKVRNIGVCNFDLSQLKKAEAEASPLTVASIQVRYNLIARNPEYEILPHAKHAGTTVIAYSPLGQGLLSGKYIKNAPRKGVRAMNRSFSPENLQRVVPLLDMLRSIADKHRKSISQVVLNWITKESCVVAIPGAKNVAQLTENAGGVGWELTPSEFSEIDRMTRELKLEKTRSTLRAAVRTLMSRDRW